jgi:hypothetical protein
MGRGERECGAGVGVGDGWDDTYDTCECVAGSDMVEWCCVLRCGGVRCDVAYTMNDMACM